MEETHCSGPPAWSRSLGSIWAGGGLVSVQPRSDTLGLAQQARTKFTWTACVVKEGSFL